MHEVRDIYYTLLGQLIEEARVPGVENLFETGSECDRLYGAMADAYRRLCRRLGNQIGEDRDVEDILCALMEIQDIVAYKMFEYGQKYPRQS